MGQHFLDLSVRRALRLFKAVVVETQGAAVFGDVADELVGGAVGQLGVDVEGDFDRGTNDRG